MAGQGEGLSRMEDNPNSSVEWQSCVNGRAGQNEGQGRRAGQECGTEQDRLNEAAGADLTHEGLMSVAKPAEVQQGLQHRLLQRRLSLLHTVLVLVDVTP